MHPQTLPPFVRMMQFISGFWVYYGLAAVARLGIADRLAGGPRMSADLATETGARPDYLYRLLRAAASVGVFAEGPEGHFRNNGMSDLLRTDHVPSLRYMFMSMGDEWASRCWPTLAETVLTGQSGPDRVLGSSSWAYIAKHPEQGENFNRAMSNMSAFESPAVVGAYDFSGISSLCDVAGGHGFLLSSILAANPHTTGTLYDLPHVIAGAKDGPMAVHAGRATLLAGDMFESVPAGFDAYIMKYIVHDWNDEQARKLLANCRKGVNPGGRLLVVDQVVNPGSLSDPAQTMDLVMMLFIDGLERTESQFRNLFESAGWSLMRVIPTTTTLRILECAAA